jgi:CRP/FNR family cyclic AMP-dependent transcriptional regulator
MRHLRSDYLYSRDFLQPIKNSATNAQSLANRRRVGSAPGVSNIAQPIKQRTAILLIIIAAESRAVGLRAKRIPSSTAQDSADPGCEPQRMAMQSTYRVQQEGSCISCKVCSGGCFCHLPESESEVLERIKVTIAYQAGATLYLEGEACRGIYILCSGRVKLSTASRDGQTIIFGIAKPGEVLGLGATVSGSPHNTTAETGQACQLSFVKTSEFIHFLKTNPEARMHAAVHLSQECERAYQHFRSFVGSSASERIARLIIEWSHDDSEMVTAHGVKVFLTHHEMAQIVGMSRETVTRTLAEFRKRRIAEFRGSTLLIRDMAALQHIAAA